MMLFFRHLFGDFTTLPPPQGTQAAALPLAVYREAGRVSRPSAAYSHPFIHFFTKDRSERVSGNGGSNQFLTKTSGYDCSNKQLHTTATPLRRPCDGMRMPPKRHVGAVRFYAGQKSRPPQQPSNQLK
ncbi:hypothetical protein [Nitratidesulfovibrio sp.]|uniref:hypothetical protein n=1 Tax=Nitratidesulfovibrio sp. TaxID=2802297 RepID=UPI0033429082